MIAVIADERCAVVEQGKQQPTPLTIKGVEFLPHANGHQPCGSSNQRQQGMVKVDLGIDRCGPTAGVDDEIHVSASDDCCMANEAPAGTGSPRDGHALTDVRTDGKAQFEGGLVLFDVLHDADRGGRCDVDHQHLVVAEAVDGFRRFTVSCDHGGHEVHVNTDGFPYLGQLATSSDDLTAEVVGGGGRGVEFRGDPNEPTSVGGLKVEASALNAADGGLDGFPHGFVAFSDAASRSDFDLVADREGPFHDAAADDLSLIHI